MADTKITALTALTAADPANDVIPIVDVSDTSMAASGTTKKISVNNILGASGTATLASAAITGAATVGTTLGVTGVSTLASAVVTGDLTVDTSTLKVDSTLNKVGIGVATLTGLSTLNVAGDIALTSDLVVKNSGGTVQGYIFGSSGLNYRVVASNPHVWQEGGTEQMRLNTTGNLVLKGGTTGANGVGLTFPATQVASSDANCLDDYEEGTWTPVAVSLTVVGSVTYPVATYTKIGRVVYINLKVTGSTSTTSTENVTYFTGLPFTPTVNSTLTAINENNVGSLGVGLFAANTRLYSPTWTSVANATLSGFYYV